MSVPVIVFVVFYCLLLLVYLVTETSGKMYLRAPNKIILASMFLIFGIVVFATKNTVLPVDSYYAIIMPALFMIWLGDVFLLFDFGRGGDFFLGGNVAFAALEILLLKNHGVIINTYWWVFLVAPVLVLIFFFLFTKFPNIFKLGKMKYPFLLYLVSIILHGITGIAVAAYLPQYLLLGLGSMLFMLSDFVITVHKFVLPKNKWVLRLNSSLYFIGVLLIVLSMVATL